MADPNYQQKDDNHQPEIDFKVFGERIRDKRILLGLTIFDLAFILKVGRARLYSWESGSLPRNPHDFFKLMDWLENGSYGVSESNKKTSVDELMRKYFMRYPKDFTHGKPVE